MVPVKLSTEQVGRAVAYRHPCNILHVQICGKFEAHSFVSSHSIVHHFGNPCKVFSTFNQIGIAFSTRTLRPNFRTAVPVVGLRKNHRRHCHQQ